MKKPSHRAIKRASYTRLHDGYFKLDHYVLDIPKHNGGTLRVQRLLLERGNSVAVLAYDPVRDQVLMINQFSIGAYASGAAPFGNTLPAGGVWQG